ncbi:1062_t:CDS:2 [Paraglomus occultum]|uniref:1062_t:CDS:1 n=1 Tax=Paraglomus occultum TaxID=144539 RepID=A0A9N9F7M9_9GLOM|nr:1062_t:CDS:2 [Paraglomus occultum]
MTIRKLNETVIRRLRASLVITSIAQCVLELVQNSIDASATTIEIRVDVSTYYVQIIDNGTGMSPEDLKKVGQRYATSKCHTLDELQKVNTYGFRGEALASIAEEAVVEIISKHSGCYDTYSKTIKGGQLIQYGPTRYNNRRSSGTTIIVRDLFYRYPVRRRQQAQTPASFANEIDSVKRAVETIALIYPNIIFTLIDTSRDAKIVMTRKTNSSISTFRQLFGVSLSQHLESVSEEENDFVIKGFISTRGLPSRQHQYFFVNNRLIAYNDIHRTIDELFAQSSFPNRVNDTLDLISSMEISSDQRQRKSMGKCPVYLLQLTCAATEYDICLDPAKNIVEFQNWGKLLKLISSLITDFLIKYKFAEHSNSYDDDNVCEDAVVRNDTCSRLRFDELLHIKCSGMKERLFNDKELRSGGDSCELSMISAPLPRVQPRQASAPAPASVEFRASTVDAPESVRTEMNEYSKWTDPITKESFYVDKRTGNSYKTIPCYNDETENNAMPVSTRGRVDKSRLRTSANCKNNSNLNLWAHDAFKKWAGSNINTSETPIPHLMPPGANMRKMTNRNLFSWSASATMDISKYRFTKQDLKSAKVIGQVDDKFIACKLQCSDTHTSSNGSSTLILVDQHAADERIRVEMLLKEFCEYDSDQAEVTDSRPRISIVETINLNPPIKVSLSTREALAAQRFIDQFNKWGIYFASQSTLQAPDTKSTAELDSSPHFSRFNDHVTEHVTHLPRMIADKCVADSRVLQEIIRQHLYWLEDTGGIGVSVDDDGGYTENEEEWPNMIRKCPRGILDIINSKACRGAIKFNDKLSRETCIELVSKLAECIFPFQCAHGRPSMIPVVSLDGVQKSRFAQKPYRYTRRLTSNDIANSSNCDFREWKRQKFSRE